jgi:hypothetical protein
MRRTFVVVLVACLLGVAMTLPADAAKKKRKKKPPVTFSADGSLAVANPATLENAGVTQNEFMATCAIPASQGVDRRWKRRDGHLRPRHVLLQLRLRSHGGIVDGWLG